VDHVVLVLLVVSFASLVTVHVALAFGLAMRRPRWRGAVAFLLPPLAPYWGMLERMRVRSLLWLIALASYVVGLIIAKVAVD
jgi:hypothetical protein